MTCERRAARVAAPRNMQHKITGNLRLQPFSIRSADRLERRLPARFRGARPRCFGRRASSLQYCIKWAYRLSPKPNHEAAEQSKRLIHIIMPRSEPDATCGGPGPREQRCPRCSLAARAGQEVGPGSAGRSQVASDNLPSSLISITLRVILTDDAPGA